MKTSFSTNKRDLIESNLIDYFNLLIDTQTFMTRLINIAKIEIENKLYDRICNLIAFSFAVNLQKATDNEVEGQEKEQQMDKFINDTINKIETLIFNNNE